MDSKLDARDCAKTEALYKFTILTRAVAAIIETDRNTVKGAESHSREFTLVHRFTKEIESVFHAALSATRTNEGCTVRSVVVGSIVHGRVLVMR